MLHLATPPAINYNWRISRATLFRLSIPFFHRVNASFLHLLPSFLSSFFRTINDRRWFFSNAIQNLYKFWERERERKSRKTNYLDVFPFIERRENDWNHCFITRHTHRHRHTEVGGAPLFAKCPLRLVHSLISSTIYSAEPGCFSSTSNVAYDPTTKARWLSPADRFNSVVTRYDTLCARYNTTRV